MGRLHLDMGSQSRYILNGIEIRYRAKNSFCLRRNAFQAENKVSLKEVAFFCQKVKPNPSIQLAHAKALQHGTAKYPLRHVEVKTFTILQQNCSFSKESLVLGQPYPPVSWSVLLTTMLIMQTLQNHPSIL